MSVIPTMKQYLVSNDSGRTLSGSDSKFSCGFVLLSFLSPLSLLAFALAHPLLPSIRLILASLRHTFTPPLPNSHSHTLTPTYPHSPSLPLHSSQTPRYGSTHPKKVGHSSSRIKKGPRTASTESPFGSAFLTCGTTWKRRDCYWSFIQENSSCPL